MPNNKTRRRHRRPIGGWKHIHISGDPYDLGIAHGRALIPELRRVSRTLPFLVGEFFKTTMPEYMRRCKRTITPIVRKKFPDIYREIQGIADGSKGVVSVDFLIAWNSFLSFADFYDLKQHRCCAFIATGSATANGDIVMAHNTHADFISGQLLNIIMTVSPTTGHTFKMQTAAGLVASSADWFVSSNGIIGCETTISNTNYEPDFKNGVPYFCRIRNVMQFAETLDECADMMTKHNAGDYPCSWLFGNTNSNEILLCEIGLKSVNIQRTNDGVFYGSNSAMSFELRSLETTDVEHDDTTSSVGARGARLDYLLHTKYYGKIDTKNARRVMSDHYDMMTQSENMSSRCICKHSEMDATTGYPQGCTDGKVVDTKMARKMEFWARFGSSCGRTYKTANLAPKYKHWKPMLDDFKRTEWVVV
jgi:hypothetical protein